jgi:hypothetical protein
VRLNSSGPYPNDDYFQVAFTDATTSNGLIFGDIIPGSAPHIDVYLGWSEKARQFFGTFEGIPDGRAGTLDFFHFHANGVLVEQFTDTGAWTWTLRSPIFRLLNFVSATADFSAILNAVQRTPTVPGQR